MKRAIIVHGFHGKPETNWKPWLKKELTAEGFAVEIPAMPDADNPEVTAWVRTLAETVGEPSGDELYLIGHSLGCITILKYLENLPEGVKVAKCVFVAGFTRLFAGYGHGHDSFFDQSLDFARIKSRGASLVAVHSRDDRLVPVDELDQFVEELDATPILVEGMGHFGSPDGVFEVPVVREAVLS